jgi:hypothetical protein
MAMPVEQIINWVEQKGCDLVAMSTHGHRFLGDMFLGSTARRVQTQHRCTGTAGSRETFCRMIPAALRNPLRND